jgi:hypothetical protein
MNEGYLKNQERGASRRVSLYECVPLSTPFSLQFSPSSYCNFKCSYCWQSLGGVRESVCARCQVPSYNVREGDCLNGHEGAILARLGGGVGG